MYCDFTIPISEKKKNKTIQCPFYSSGNPFLLTLKPTIEGQYKNLKNANMQYASKGLHFIMYDDKGLVF